MAGRAGGRLTLDALRIFIADRVKGQSIEKLFDQLKVVSGGDGNCTCELIVSPKMLNESGNLHGGVSATLVDAVSSYALVTTGSGRIGSSINLNIRCVHFVLHSYLRPVKAHEVITITARTLNCGKTIAFSLVDITKTHTGQLIAQGSHTKFVGEPKSEGPSISPKSSL